MHRKVTTIEVWDPAIRLFHWLLVCAFLIAYIFEGEFIRLHLLSGSTVLGLLIFRIIWGFIGTRHARFIEFVFSPKALLKHLQLIVYKETPRHLGHNPAGSYMIFALLTALSALTLSGLFLYGHDEGAGPLAAMTAEWSLASLPLLENIHNLTAQLVIVMVVLHVAGVLLESLFHGENLIRAMVTGEKEINDKEFMD